MEEWKSNILNEIGDKTNLVFDSDNILHCRIKESKSFDFHINYSKGAFLRELSKKKNHQIHWETPYYERILNTYIPNKLGPEDVLLDLGSGDGRFTEYLLKKGANKIVCVDFDIKLLKQLSLFLKQNNVEDKVLLINSGWENLPIKKNVFSIVMAIGVLYYSNERYTEAIAEIKDLLKEDGILITSEPDMEGFLIRILFLNGLSKMIENFESKKFKESTKENAPDFRFFSEDELHDIYQNNGFKIIDRKGISMFHNLIRVLFVNGKISENELSKNYKNLSHLFDYLHENGRLFKHLVWKLQK